MLILTSFTCVFLCFSERISKFEFMNLSGLQAHSEVGELLLWEVKALSRHLTCLGFDRTYSTRNLLKSRKCLEHGFAQQRFHSKMGDLALYSIMEDSKTFRVSSFEASGFSQSQSAMPHDAEASFVGSSCAAASTCRTPGEMLQTWQLQGIFQFLLQISISIWELKHLKQSVTAWVLLQEIRCLACSSNRRFVAVACHSGQATWFITHHVLSNLLFLCKSWEQSAVV